MTVWLDGVQIIREHVQGFLNCEKSLKDRPVSNLNDQTNIAVTISAYYVRIFQFWTI